MRAIVQDSYGGPEVLALKDASIPEAGDDKLYCAFVPPVRFAASLASIAVSHTRTCSLSSPS